MALKPWERYGQAGGDPIIAPADPYKQANEVRAQQDQSLQVEAAGRAERAEARADRAEQRAAANDQRAMQQDQLGTESERTAGFLSGRIVDSVGRLSQAIQANRSAARPTLGVEAARTVFGDTAANYLTDSERQQVRAAQLDIVDAGLTLGTGAAYTAEQLEAYREIYFPKLGDSEETANSKRQALRSLLENAATKAGRAAPDLQKAIDALDALEQDPTRQAGGGIEGYDPEQGLLPTVTDDTPTTPIGTGGGPVTDGPGGRGSLMDLANQGVTLGLSDEAQGIGGYLSALITGDDASAAYVRDRDAARQRIQQAREDNPVIGTALEFLGGGGAARIAAPVANALGSVVRQGAGLGAVGGYGYGEGQGSVGNALLGAAGGAAFGGALYGAGRGISSIANRRQGPAPTAEQLALVQAGERQGVPMRQADVRPELRNRRAELESRPVSGPMIQGAASDDAEAIAARSIEATGGAPFARNDATSMGQSAQRVAERGQQAVRDSASDFYTRSERLAPGFTTQPSQTTTFIDSKIAELRARSPSGYQAEISALEAMKSDLQQTGLSVATLQAQRETIGGRIGDNVADRTRADRTFTQVLQAASDELHTALRNANPQAAALLKRGDAKWTQYKTLQREVTTRFLGRRGDATAESAARELNSEVSRNYSALRRFMTMASPQERSDFAATFVRDWGLNRKGEFSAAIFANNLEGVSDRNLIALVGRDGRNALRDLQAISKAKVDAASRTSPSGAAISGASGGLKNLLLSTLGFATTGPVGAVGVPVAGNLIRNLGERRAARMLLNPDFTKWLRNAPNSSNPRVIDRYFSRLAGISSIPANDNQAFTSALRQAFQQSPGALAAQEEGERGPVPPQ